MFRKENPTLRRRIRNAAMAAVIAASQVQVSRAEQSVPATELQEVVVRTLGRNPVARAENGRTAIEVGFEDKTNDGIHNSPIENSARVVAKRFGLTDAEIEKFIEDLHNKYRNHFIAASRVDGYEFIDTDGVKISDVHILGNSSGVMGNGSGTAQDVEFKFSSPEQVVRMRYTLPDGRTFDFMLAQTCANPIMTQPDATPIQKSRGACVDNARWRNTTEHSDSGIYFGKTRYRDFSVVHAPKGTVVDNIDMNAVESVLGKLPRHNLLYIDNNCDGHPEEIWCLVWKDGKWTVSPLAVENGRAYNSLSIDAQIAWVSA